MKVMIGPEPGSPLGRCGTGRVAPVDGAARRGGRCRKAPHPQNGRVDAHPELRRRPVAGHAAPLNRCHYPLAKIDRIRFALPCWPPSQPAC
jgi:hypothetical protein